MTERDELGLTGPERDELLSGLTWWLRTALAEIHLQRDAGIDPIVWGGEASMPNVIWLQLVDMVVGMLDVDREQLDRVLQIIESVGAKEEPNEHDA